jgi:beta-lactamase superfamily II metal-dependent hydrolase
LTSGTLEIFDVDHGACALLTMPSWNNVSKHVLIDCGHSTSFNGGRWTPGYQLRHRRINHIDLLICTNYDEDHASGVPSLLEHGITVGSILGNPTVPAAVIEHLKSEDGMGSGIEVLVNSLGARRARGEEQIVPDIPGLSLRWAWNPWPHWDTENNLSLVAHLDILGYKFLFPGDMEKDGFTNLLRNVTFASWMSGIDVLIAAHHGRENGKCESMFDDFGCFPQLVVISDCAKRHQSQETVGYYYSKSRGIAGFRGQGPRSVLTTRSDGYIRFQFEGGHRSSGGSCLIY